MNFSQNQIVIAGAAIAVLLVFSILVFFNLRPSQIASIQLSLWGFEREDAITPLLSGYSKLYPDVKVSYKEVSKDNYENTLLGALASGQGPDIFPVHNRSLSKNAGVISPVQPSRFGVSQIQNLFPKEVGDDFVLGATNSSAGQVYALPLYFDTLSLIYNKDLFDQAGIANPPATWDEFQADVAKIKMISPNGQIIRAGAAIGGSRKTVTNAVDILNVLMLQNGVAMTFGQSYASFASDAGAGAFNFYLRFADSGSNYYTWNESQPNDFNSFSAGNAAMVIGYNSDIQKIRAKSPFLRVGVAPLPQINPSNAVNYADYWGLAVSKQSKNQDSAFDFMLFMTTNPQAAGQYSEASGNPPALRELISQKINDPVFGVFARQALTARSWYETDKNRIDVIFGNAIVNALGGSADAKKILVQAQDQITQLMQTK